jgi:branched-chain amino acid transport system substrate-binding protein
MSKRIGFLLPRSTDYPAMAFDLLDGLRIYLRNNGYSDAQFFSENIGFGDDLPNVYARAEKLIMQDDADLIVAYTNPQNAEILYPLAESSGKPFIFLDAGMQFVNETVPANCTHISLQGLSCLRHMGRMAAEGEKKVLIAVSFFDAGFRCSMASLQGVEESNGSITGNFVSGHKISEFTIDRYMELLRDTQPDSVIANFSIYLTELFTTALKNAGAEALAKPFYGGPFMFEEQIAAKCDFPGGTWRTAVPWHSGLENENQKVFADTIQKEKNKTANMFHLLGWEAGIVAKKALSSGSSIAGYTYESPRGTVTIHPKTLTSYAPIYSGSIEANADGKCSFRSEATLPASAEEHIETFGRTMDMPSGWRNNYFCT